MPIPSDKPKERFCYVYGYELKEDTNNYIIGGYIATTHLDSGFYDNSRETFIRDKISKETLNKWAGDINSGNPRSNKVSVHHQRDKHVAGVAVKGSARVDNLKDGEYGLWVDTSIDKTHPNFNDTKNRLEGGFIDSFSIEFTTKDPMIDNYIDGAVSEVPQGKGIVRTLLPNTILEGYTLASQPMNEHAIRVKEVTCDKCKVELTEDKDCKLDLDKDTNKEEVIKMETEVKTVEQPKVEVSKEDYAKLEKLRDMEIKEQKEKEYIATKAKVMEEIKMEADKINVEVKVMKNPTNIEKKEYVEYKEVLSSRSVKQKDGTVLSSISMDEQWKRAGAYANDLNLFKGSDWKTTKDIFTREYKVMYNNGLMEFKGLGLTTNQNTDTDYLISAAELNDIFDPVIYNALNEKTVTWNLLKKDDYSNKGNALVQFALKTVANSTAGAYTGNAINTSNTTRLKMMTKFKKYQVGVEVDGDMIAAARGGPIGDVFAQEVNDSTASLLSVINVALFAEVGVETASGIIGFELISDSAGNTTLYNMTRSTTNKLAPASAGDTYINGASADLSLTNLRAAKRQALNEGCDLNNLVYISHPIQGDKLRGIYDEAQRMVPTSSRYGFEGMMSFDGIPFFEDKDCNSDDVWLVDLDTHRVAVWVPPTLEMLGKDADSQKGFIKTYFATYNRKPRALVQIYGNATS